MKYDKFDAGYMPRRVLGFAGAVVCVIAVLCAALYFSEPASAQSSHDYQVKDQKIPRDDDPQPPQPRLWYMRWVNGVPSPYLYIW